MASSGKDSQAGTCLSAAHGRRAFPLRQELLGGGTVLGGPECRQARRLAFEHRAEDLDGGLGSPDDGAGTLHQERRPARILQSKDYI